MNEMRWDDLFSYWVLLYSFLPARTSQATDERAANESTEHNAHTFQLIIPCIRYKCSFHLLILLCQIEHNSMSYMRFDVRIWSMSLDKWHNMCHDCCYYFTRCAIPLTHTCIPGYTSTPNKSITNVDCVCECAFVMRVSENVCMYAVLHGADGSTFLASTVIIIWI